MGNVDKPSIVPQSVQKFQDNTVSFLCTPCQTLKILHPKFLGSHPYRHGSHWFGWFANGGGFSNEEAELNSLVELFVQAFEQIDLLVPEEFYEFVSAFVQKSSNASADLLVQEPNEAHEELFGETSHNECGFQGDANGGLDDLFFDVGGLGCKL